MFERIVVATDGTPRGDSAVSWASLLGRRVGACELVTVAGGGCPAALARRTLEQTAASNGWLPAACTVLRGGDVAETLLTHLASRRGSLMVMASHGAHPLTSPRPANVTRRVLAHTRVPVLVVGPHVIQPAGGELPTLVVCVQGGDPLVSTIDAVESWTASFSTSPWVVEVVPTSIDADNHGRRHIERWRHVLESRGLLAAGEVLHGGDPVEWLDEFTETLPAAIYVVSTLRYGDDSRHLHSTTRELIHRSRRPVLVVNASPRIAELAERDSNSQIGSRSSRR